MDGNRGAAGERRTGTFFPAARGPGSGTRPWLLLGYAAFLVYGSLFPFSGWRPPGPGEWLQSPWQQHLSRTDLATNALLYVPFGFLAVRAFSGSGWKRVLVAALSGAALSGGLESLQTLLPGRISSLMDLSLNAAGACLGGIAGQRVEAGAAGGLSALRRSWVLPGRWPEVALFTLGLWAMAQLAPLVPSLDVGKLREGVRPIWHVLQGSERLDVLRAFSYALSLTGTGLLALLITPLGQPAVKRFTLFAGTVLCLKVLVVSRQLSLEALMGLGAALAVLFPCRSRRGRGIGIGAALCLVAAFAAGELQAGPHPLTPHPMNWIPLGSSARDLSSLESLAEGAWPFLGLACSIQTLVPGSRGKLARGAGVAAVCAFVLALEFAQQWVPGRTPDASAAVVPALAWYLAWTFGSPAG